MSRRVARGIPKARSMLSPLSVGGSPFGRHARLYHRCVWSDGQCALHDASRK
jgi:hypothetical protein